MFSDTLSLPLKQLTKVDRSGLTGFGLIAFLGLVILFGGSSVGQFFDLKSVLIVFGGTCAAALVNFSLHDLRFAFRTAGQALQAEELGAVDLIHYFVRLGQKVRAEGTLTLEKESRRTHNPFLRRAFELAADGQSEADIRRILETERSSLRERESRAIQVFEGLGTYAPALGLIGTLVGLIQMLGLLQDPTQVGPAMSLALLTTLYGALSANLVFLPLAGKIRVRSDEQVVIGKLIVEGATSLLRQEHSHLIEQRLITYLPSFVRE